MENILKNVSYGTKRKSMGRTITEGDFSMLVNLNWTIGTIHADSEAMKSDPFGERILPGVCVLSTTIGLSNSGNVRGLMSDQGFRLVALLGFEEVRFVGPVYPGDTITVESEIIDARPTSDPKRCVARLRDVTTRQTGERVLEAVRSELYELVK
ncbi:MAG TPA: MaoC/PaaZ C-terminal domain-containing protein [Dehalococcoidia bacterium]|jgi:acyl dehydratase|nr:MaoC/PaaZ C-terminal domain-containing protein [Dehalococcoidia bacterium]